MIVIFRILNNAAVEIYSGLFEQYVKCFSKKIKILISIKTLLLAVSLGNFREYSLQKSA